MGSYDKNPTVFNTTIPVRTKESSAEGKGIFEHDGNGKVAEAYAHCSALHVAVGQTVKQGQVIADCGSTGYSTGPHCYFEIIQNGVRVDALLFFKAK